MNQPISVLSKFLKHYDLLAHKYAICVDARRRTLARVNAFARRVNARSENAPLGIHTNDD